MARATKVMISVPPDLLEQIDRAADQRGTSRSAFLQEAARSALGRLDPVEFDAIVERARAALADVGPFESAGVVRAERDALDARDRGR